MRTLKLLTALSLSAAFAIPVLAADEEVILGAGVAIEESTSIAAILADPDAWIGKRVRIEGGVLDVCPMKGCWVSVGNDEANLRVKVEDDVIVFPADSKGRIVAAEGVVEAIERDEGGAARLARPPGGGAGRGVRRRDRRTGRRPVPDDPAPERRRGPRVAPSQRLRSPAGGLLASPLRNRSGGMVMRSDVVRVALLALLLAMGIADVGFTDEDEADDPFAHLEYRNIGPVNMSGRVADVEGIAGDPRVLYVGSASGGVWKTTNGGLTFRSDLRRPAGGVDRRPGAGAVESGGDLRRLGRVERSQQRWHRQRRLQVDRRWAELDARRPRGDPARFAGGGRSDRSRHGVRRCPRAPVRPQRGARCLSVEGRWRELGRRSSIWTTATASPTSTSTRPTRTCCSRRCGTSTASRGRTPPEVRRGECGVRSTVATAGRSSRPVSRS